APGDRPAPPLQGRTNKTAALDPAPTDPSWPIPAADRVNVRESSFAEAFNGLLQQNLPSTDMAVYSITSSARASSEGDTVRSSALAVLRLTANSNFVGISTGSSLGFLPRNIRST